MNRFDWARWPHLYDRPGGSLGQRLRIVQDLIRRFLAARQDEEVAVVSLCAGDGRDILDVLADHERGRLVRGRLIERDPANAARAARRAREAALDRIEVVRGDASLTDACAGAVPADLVLVCGVFGNIPDDHVRRTVDALPQLCARGATVIWTRHRRAPDLTPSIRRWFEATGFAELAFESTAADPPFPVQAVGAHGWPHEPAPLELGKRLFSFYPA